MLMKTALQTFKRAKQYYLTTVITLALTLSMVLSAFSLVDLVFFSPLPYKNSDNIYLLEGTLESKSYSGPGTNSQIIEYIKSNNTVFSDVATYHQWSNYKLFDNQKRPEVNVILASSNLFEILGVQAQLGRLFSNKESLGNKQTSIILGYRTWQQEYNADKNIIGRKIQLNQRRFTVIGVAPDNLVLPQLSNINSAFWIPIDMDETFDPKTANGFMGAFKGIARAELNQLDNAKEQIKTLSETAAQLYAPNVLKDFKISAQLTDFNSALKGDSGNIVLMLLLGVSLLMLIALINLSSMQLAKAVTKIKSIAISFAFGATNKQLIIESFKHNTIVISISVIFALILTQTSFEIIQQLASNSIQRLDTLAISFNTILVSALLTILIALLYSYIELSVVKEKNLTDSLQSSGKGTGKQISSGVSHSLIGLQILFSFLVLVSASHVVLDTLSEALRGSGIDTKNKWSLTINYANIKNSEERINLHKSIINQLSNLDSIDSVTVTSESRLPESLNVNQVYDENNQYIAQARKILIGHDYLHQLGITVDGKNFSKGDRELNNPPILVNQRLANILATNNQDVIAKKISLDGKTHQKIIGVTSNINVPGSQEDETYEIYIPKSYSGWRQYSYLITTYEPLLVEQQIINNITEIDSRLDINRLASLTQLFDEKRKHHLTAAWISIVLASVSLLMVCIGINGIVNYLVQVRRYTLGVKLAMGADNRRLLKDSIIELMQPISMSLILAFSICFLVVGYSISNPNFTLPVNWGLILSIWVGLFIISLIVSYFPIQKTLKQDPIKALRNE